MDNTRKNIISVQSHVSYGFVGNKAAMYPLQNMGFDLWPINTVDFSNHTGYGKWTGQINPPELLSNLIAGLQDIEAFQNCSAIISGFMGSRENGLAMIEGLKTLLEDPKIPYLCDPVMVCDPVALNKKEGFFAKGGLVDFFKHHAIFKADIITPNHFEMEVLWGSELTSAKQTYRACDAMHAHGIKTILIKDYCVPELSKHKSYVFLANDSLGKFLLSCPKLSRSSRVNGKGDLFSALFLGYSLLGYDALTATKQTMSCMYEVLSKTYALDAKELAILAHNYAEIPDINNIAIEKY